MLRAILAILFLWVATPALAQTAEDEAAEAQKAVQSFARQTQAYEAIILEASQVATATLDRIDEAIDMAETGTRKSEVRRWADGWVPGDRAKLVEFERRVKALPPVDISEFETLGKANDPRIRRLRLLAKSYPEQAIASVASSRALFETIAEAAPPAATGDADAMLHLGLATFESGRAMLMAENGQLTRSMLGIGEDHPQYWLLRSIVSTNAVLIEIFNGGIAESLDAEFDVEVRSVRVNQLIQQARDDAEKIEPAATVMIAGVKSNPSVSGTAFARQIDDMFSSYGASGTVELKLCDALSDFLHELKKQGSFLDVMESGLEPIDPLVNERLEIDSKRRAKLAQ